MRRLGAGVLVVTLWVTACGKSNGLLPPMEGGTLPPAASCTGAPVAATEPGSVDSISENVDATCASVVGFLAWKTGAAGAACAGPLDCAPVCCPCPNGTHHTLASWCDHGQCAAPDAVACMVAGSALKSCGN